MHIFLFLFYSAVLCFALTKISFFRKSGIRPGMLLAFFGLRVLAGCLHNWIAYRYYPNHGDIWLFFQNSFITRHELFTDFRVFWKSNSVLAYLPHNLIEWMHVIFDFLSFDNLYINTLFFCFLTFGGYIALFLVFYRRLGHNILSALCAVLLPSVLFWTSCIHLDGLVYALLGWLIFYLNQLFTTGWNNRRAAGCVLLAFAAIFLRPALAAGLLPALAFWIMAERRLSRKQWTGLATGLGLFVLFLFMLWPGIFSGALNALSQRQKEFQALTGGSRIELPVLEASGSSLLHVLPKAIFNGFFQPTLNFGGQRVYLIFAVELVLIWIVIILGLVLFRQKPEKKDGNPGFSGFCLLLALIGMLLIGYIIPFVGAIVRYRSIYLPFLLAPFLNKFDLTLLNIWLKEKIFKGKTH